MDESFVTPLIDWYKKSRRDLPWRRQNSAYEIWISEIMLQQTRVAAVIPYYGRFLSAFPTPAALADADDTLLMKLWEGLGYYSRARNLKRAARAIVERFGGELPRDYGALLTLPGIGDYTAGAIASIAYRIPVPAVDGNVVRVLLRMRNSTDDAAEPGTKAKLRSELLAMLGDEASPAHADAGTFNAAMMELGATVCVPNGAPHCDVCPVRAFCEAGKAGTAERLPIRSKKAPRRIEEKTVFVLRLPDGRLLGGKRDGTGLLASLYRLVEAEGILDEPDMAKRLTAWGLHPTGELMVFARKHVFTHIEWHMRVAACDVAAPGALPDGMIPLETGYALPTAYRICIPKEFTEEV